MPAGEGERLKVFLEKNIGCFYRYFGEDIESSKIGLNHSFEVENWVTKINSIYPRGSVKGCAIIQNENNNNFRMEVVLIGETKAKIFYIFLENSKFQLYYWALKKTESKWQISTEQLDKAVKWGTLQMKTFTFKYKLKDSHTQTSGVGVHDLMSDSPLNLTMATGSISEQIMDLKKQGDGDYTLELFGTWVKRDKYCENIKDQRISALSEKSKIEEWCSSRP